MFQREKKCPNCGRKIKIDYSFCPYCGEELTEKEEFRPFSIFEEIDKEFERIDRMFASEFKFPEFKPITRGGISITITSATGREPKIEVKTSGEYKKLEPEIKKRLGIKPRVEEVEEIEKKPTKVKVPKITEEPEAKIETIGNKKRVQIKLPSVKSEDDIEIKDLEQSIEIKAFAGDKVYFKLLPIVGTVTKKGFKDGVLEIEVET